MAGMYKDYVVKLRKLGLTVKVYPLEPNLSPITTDHINNPHSSIKKSTKNVNKPYIQKHKKFKIPKSQTQPQITRSFQNKKFIIPSQTKWKKPKIATSVQITSVQNKKCNNTSSPFKGSKSTKTTTKSSSKQNNEQIRINKLNKGKGKNKDQKAFIISPFNINNIQKKKKKIKKKDNVNNKLIKQKRKEQGMIDRFAIKPNDNNNNTICNKSSTTISSNSRQRIYICQYCGKTFRDTWNLSAHVRSHTNERPFKCINCNKSYKYNKDLQG
eukprot:188514_1